GVALVPDEDREDALVRVADALPRSVDVEHPKRRDGGLHARDGSCDLRVPLSRALRHAVVRDRDTRDALRTSGRSNVSLMLAWPAMWNTTEKRSRAKTS